MRLILICAIALVISGCAHSGGEAQKANGKSGQNVSSGLLKSTNSPPGAVYNIKVYVVNRGDTLSSIGSRFHKSVAALTALNPDINPNRLRIGQKLLITEDKVN
jgi:LysM repeat protein